MNEAQPTVGIDQWRLALFDADSILARQRAKLLASRTTTLDYRFEIGITPLISACVGNNASIVEVLLDLGASLEFRDDQGWSALHWCAQSGRDACAEILLRRGADPNCSTLGEHSTPLHFSANSSTARVGKLLIEYGADPFACEKPSMRTPIQAGAGRPEWLSALEINLKATDCDGSDMCALSWAVKGSDSDAAALGACRYWTRLGARPSLSLSNNHPEILAHKFLYVQTALYLASFREQDEIQRALRVESNDRRQTTRAL